VRVMGIEMCYIPQVASFEIGDGNGTNECSYAFHVTGSDNTAVAITSAYVSNLTTDDDSGHIHTPNVGDIDNTPIGIQGGGGVDEANDGAPCDHPNFPTGYDAFYLMKYEISQGQYRDFLNMLATSVLQGNRCTAGGPSGGGAGKYMDDAAPGGTSWNSRNTIVNLDGGDPATFGCNMDYDGTADESNDGEWISCNFLSPGDFAAYYDWAALRWYTELEYEKAISKAPNNPVGYLRLADLHYKKGEIDIVITGAVLSTVNVMLVVFQWPTESLNQKVAVYVPSESVLLEYVHGDGSSAPACVIVLFVLSNCTKPPVKASIGVMANRSTNAAISSSSKSKASWSSSELAGSKDGNSVGKLRWFKILKTISGSVMNANITSNPWHLEHTVMSNLKTLWSKSDQGRK